MATIPVGSTEQAMAVTAVVNGVNLGIFDSHSGGDTTSKPVQHRPGGMGPRKSYAALPDFSDIKVSRVCKSDLDWPNVPLLRSQAGRVTGSVTIQPLDGDGNAFGSPQTTQGIFLGISGIKSDSESDAVSMYDLDFTVDNWS